MTVRSLLRRLAILCIAGLAFLGLLVVVATATPLAYWWATVLAGPWNDPGGDTLIILGGSVLGDGVIGENSYWRAIYGSMVYREGGFRQVVISGGPQDRRVIAEPIREYLRCQGVPEDRIVLENRSTSTRENALFTAQLLRGKPGRVVLLTSDYHMYRAWHAFRKAGLEVLPRPVPDARRRALSLTGRWPAFVDVARESVKIAYYWWQDWI
jgi:uncharacterized SAM-binding protein YcdF (DUF218 family)